jgi:hypothetical protein
MQRIRKSKNAIRVESEDIKTKLYLLHINEELIIETPKSMRIFKRIV